MERSIVFENSKYPEEDPKKSDEQTSTNTHLNRSYNAPAQEQTKQRIEAYKSQIVSLTKIQLGGSSINGEIKKARFELDKNEKVLRKQVQNAKNQQKLRLKQKKQKELLSGNAANTSADNNGADNLLVARNPWRPRKEDEYPELLKAICDIAIFNSAADDRRQTEMIRTCTTLNDLTNKLQEQGFKISRSAVYLRLLPRRSNSLEGVRHVKTVPVRLCKPQNDLHGGHLDAKFCTATIRCVDTLVSMLGPKQVAYISQDDKAWVKIGITAANKQAPRMMHVEYRIKLPDHDWAVASKHNLIPSVYAGIHIKSGSFGSPEAVTYSGPTYINIRSGKHSSSAASTHANDIDRLYELDSFKDILRINEEYKPILIISVDGGPDENPR